MPLRASEDVNLSHKNLRGGVELPTNPECFRGCSTIFADKRSLLSDSSFALEIARSRELPSMFLPPSSRRFLIDRRAVSSWRCGRVNVVRSVRRDRRRNHSNGALTILSKYKPTPQELRCKGGNLIPRPRAYESPALPLSYPGPSKTSSQFTPPSQLPTNSECFRRCSTTELPWREQDF